MAGLEQPSDEFCTGDERPLPGSGVVGGVPIVAQEQIVTRRHREGSAIGRRCCVGFVQCRPVDGHDAVTEGDLLTGQPDDPFDHASPDFGRLGDNEVAAAYPTGTP